MGRVHPLRGGWGMELPSKNGDAGRQARRTFRSRMRSARSRMRAASGGRVQVGAHRSHRPHDAAALASLRRLAGPLHSGTRSHNHKKLGLFIPRKGFTASTRQPQAYDRHYEVDAARPLAPIGGRPTRTGRDAASRRPACTWSEGHRPIGYPNRMKIVLGQKPYAAVLGSTVVYRRYWS